LAWKFSHRTWLQNGPSLFFTWIEHL